MRQPSISNANQPNSVQNALSDHRLSSSLVAIEPILQTTDEFDNRVKRFYQQLTTGCQQSCDYLICASNPKSKRIQPEVAAIMALQLAKNDTYLCPRIPEEVQITTMPPLPFIPLLTPSNYSSNQSSRNHSRSSSAFSFTEKSNPLLKSLYFGNSLDGKLMPKHSRSVSDLSSKFASKKHFYSKSNGNNDDMSTRSLSPSNSDSSSLNSIYSTFC